MRRVAIVGGGLTGLSTAYHLERLSDCEVHLFEPGPLGGKVESSAEDGFLVESSADSLFTRRERILKLIEELELEDRLVMPQARGFSMLISERLWAIGPGLISFGAIDRSELRGADFLTAKCKQEVLAEEQAPGGSGDDESVASFFRRRYGREFSEKVVEPLLAGTHSGLPEKLSMKALYPEYLRMVREYGSLTRGVRARTTGTIGPTFVSFREGMYELVDRLRERITRTRFHCNQVKTLEPSAGRYWIDEAVFDAIVLAVPAFDAATILVAPAPKASTLLGGIEAASSSVVTLGFRSPELVESLVGTGFLVPYTENSLITGATFSSAKWPARAPKGCALIRAFLGREGVLDVNTHSDEELRRIAVQELSKLLPLPAVAEFVRIKRWTRALPQYRVGHCDLLARIEAEMAHLPGVHLAGQFYRGAGIPDCLRQGREAAISCSCAVSAQ